MQDAIYFPSMIPESEATLLRSVDVVLCNRSWNSFAPLPNNGENFGANSTDGSTDETFSSCRNAASEEMSLVESDLIGNGNIEENEKDEISMDESPLVIDLSGSSEMDGNEDAAMECGKNAAAAEKSVISGEKEAPNNNECVNSNPSPKKNVAPSSIPVSAIGVSDWKLVGCEAYRGFAPYGANEENKPQKISRYTQVYEWEFPPTKKRRKSSSKSVGMQTSPSSSGLSAVSSNFRTSYFAKLQSINARGNSSSTSKRFPPFPWDKIPQPMQFTPFELPPFQRQKSQGKSKDPIESVKSYLSSTNYKPTSTRRDRYAIISNVLLPPEGCARLTPFNGIRKSRHWFYFSMHPARSQMVGNRCYNSLDKVTEHSKRKRRAPLTASSIAQYEWMRENPVVIRLGRSKIHGIGVFAGEDILAGQFIMEYKGELIRSTLVDKREEYYRSKGIGTYMFKLDLEFTVDGTMKGGVARFVNHSCEPNCKAKVVKGTAHKKHIVLFAAKKISKGEELSYDYKMPKEREKIPCLCSSRSCRKYLN